MRALYSLLHYLVLPYVIGRLALRGLRNPAYWERWGERFGYGPRLADGPTPTLWIHAVSMGEVQAAGPLGRSFAERHPKARIVMTTTTPTGSQRVGATLGNAVVHRYVPYDTPGPVRRFLDSVRPDIAVMMETELWPNIIHECRRRDVPVLVANARLSGRSAAGYARLPGLTRFMLQGLAALAVQHESDARRLIDLGAARERVRVTGSVKFDVHIPASLREQGQVLRRFLGTDRRVWIAASTHEGEEEMVLDAFSRVLQRLPDCLLVLVPRHPERFSRVSALCRRRGYSTVRRTAAEESCHGVDVYLGDTMGELPLLYAAADVAFVGGSLVPIGGHNMLEPAALGLPIVTGPHVHNFAEISARLREIGATRAVTEVRDLAETVCELLLDANQRHNAGERGRRFVEENRGAINRVVELVEEFLPRARATAPARIAALEV